LNYEGYFDTVVKGRAIQREMTPQDLVGALLFLASPESDFISGQSYIVDGGAVMH
jgi:NAD(P)-dependent dehydrogenase (short-subunit alcohol dehydrogenase family)